MNTDIALTCHDLCRIIDFNFFPIVEMDDSWWPQQHLTPSTFKRLIKTKVARRQLSDFILRSYQLKHEVYYNFSTPEKQAVLLSSRDLKALLYSLGLMIESDTIAYAIERETQRAIKQSLGEVDYLYALKNRISMQHSQSSQKMMPATNKTCDFSNFKHWVYQSGLRCLLSLLDDMPPGFIQRVLFKLPKSWNTSSVTSSRDDYHYMRTYLAQLLKEFKTP